MPSTARSGMRTGNGTPPKRALNSTASLPRLRPGSPAADVEHDLAVADVLGRHLHAFLRGVDDDVRGLAVVRDPLDHGPQQVGPARLALLVATGQGRISCSSSVRLVRNEGRLNNVSAYLMMLRAWLGGRSTSQRGRRHRIGAMLQSTSENSSLMK
jgi:hypothetical protein